jgi:hypothetical protein
MSFDPRISSRESRPLLEDVPPSYHTIDDVDEAISPTDSDVETTLANKFSRVEICWILAGLWSAVFLGALDGKQKHVLFRPLK